MNTTWGGATSQVCHHYLQPMTKTMTPDTTGTAERLEKQYATCEHLNLIAPRSYDPCDVVLMFQALTSNMSAGAQVFLCLVLYNVYGR